MTLTSDFDLFQLPEEHQELRTALRALCEKQIAPHAPTWTKTRASHTRP